MFSASAVMAFVPQAVLAVIGILCCLLLGPRRPGQRWRALGATAFTVMLMHAVTGWGLYWMVISGGSDDIGLRQAFSSVANLVMYVVEFVFTVAAIVVGRGESAPAAAPYQPPGQFPPPSQPPPGW